MTMGAPWTTFPLLTAAATRYILRSQMWRRMWGLGLVAVVAAITGVLACRQLVGITDNPPEDLVTSFCGLPYGTNVCASCVQASCCTESAACAADATCSAYESCLGKCSGDPKCRSQCTIDNPVGTASDVSALSACLASNCESACGLACGGVANLLSPPGAAVACEQCLQQKSACAQGRACGTSVECDGLWRCWLACTTVDCLGACTASNDAGASLVRDLYQEYSGVCSAACNYGNDWTCAGTFNQWPSAQSPTVNLTWWVYDYQSQTGVNGADVEICTSCPCPSANAPVLAHGSTDSNGYFTLPVPQVVSPVGVPSALCVQATAAGYMTTFQQFVPLSKPAVSIQDLLTPPAAAATPLLTVSAQTANETAFGATYDPARGVIGVTVWDCLGSPANDVNVTLMLDGGDEGVVVLGASMPGPTGCPRRSPEPSGALAASSSLTCRQEPSR